MWTPGLYRSVIDQGYHLMLEDGDVLRFDQIIIKVTQNDVFRMVLQNQIMGNKHFVFTLGDPFQFIGEMVATSFYDGMMFFSTASNSDLDQVFLAFVFEDNGTVLRVFTNHLQIIYARV